MTVVATNISSGPYTGNGSTTVFPFTFSAGNTDEVQVLVNGVATVSGFVITLNSGGAGGNVTFTSAPASGATILIQSNPDFEQEVQFQNNGAFLPSVVEGALDQAARRDIFLKGLLNNISAIAIAASVAVSGAVSSAVAAAQAAINAAVFVVTSASGQTVSTRSLLAGISSPVNGQVATLTEAGRQGRFIFSTANLSTQVTADPYQGLYVAPTAATSGASGAWVRDVVGSIYFLSWWGVSAAFGVNAHLPFQSATNLVPAGSTLMLPNEAITISAGVPLKQDNLKLFGSGIASEIIHNPATACFTMLQTCRSGQEMAYFTVTGKPNNLNAGNASNVLISPNVSGAAGSISNVKVHDLYLRNSSLPFAIFGNAVPGVGFFPVIGADVWNLTIETNVMGMEVFGADNTNIRAVRVTYFEALSVHNSSNTLTPGMRLLSNHGLRIHDCQFDGMAPQQSAHAAMRFSAGNSDGENLGRRSNQDIVVERCSFTNFWEAAIVDECRGDCIIRNCEFIQDTSLTTHITAISTQAATGTALGMLVKIGRLIVEDCDFTGYSLLVAYDGNVGHVSFRRNRWLGNSATVDATYTLAQSQFGGIGLVEFIGNEAIVPSGVNFNIATAASTETVRVFGNTISEAAGNANITTPFAAFPGAKSGPGLFPQDQNRQYPLGTWAARIAYGDRT